jgi:hypothetical protein
MDDVSLKILVDAIGKKHLSIDAARALYEIALDPHGIEKATSAGLVASILDISMERSNQAIIELLTKNLLISSPKGNETRIFANYELLKIGDFTRRHLLKRHEIFEDMRESHSKNSLKSLDDFFDLNIDTIYLGCEVTSHNTFRRLTKRAEEKKRTIFLMPKRKFVSPARYTHYDEVLAEWVNYIEEGPDYLRKYIRIRITDRAFPQLYTSGLSEDQARFNLYFLNAKTTRRGSLLQVKKGTSLYQLIFDNYQEAIKSSIPYWRLWPIESTVNILLKLLLPLSLIVIGIILTKLNNAISITLSAIILGLVANIIWENIESRSWIQIKLFRK